MVTVANIPMFPSLVLASSHVASAAADPAAGTIIRDSFKCPTTSFIVSLFTESVLTAAPLLAIYMQGSPDGAAWFDLVADRVAAVNSIAIATASAPYSLQTFNTSALTVSANVKDLHTTAIVTQTTSQVSIRYGIYSNIGFPYLRFVRSQNTAATSVFIFSAWLTTYLIPQPAV